MTAEDFKQIYFSFHPKLYRIAFSILNNAEDAEDIIQDAYCKLWDKREKLIDIQNPEAFCVTSVKNLCMDYMRSSRVFLKDSIIEDLDFADGNTTIIEDLENRETIVKIKSIMHALPKKQKNILHLRGFAGCSLEEIETITGESAVNIRVLLSRARKTIRTKLNI